MLRRSAGQNWIVLGLFAFLVIFLLSNLSPSVSLVVAGSVTRSLPLALWLGLAIGLGAFTSLIIYICFQLVSSTKANSENRAYGSGSGYRTSDFRDPLEEDDEFANDWVDEELTPQPRPWSPPAQPQPSPPPSQASPSSPSPTGTQPDRESSQPPAWEDPEWEGNSRDASDWSDTPDEFDDWGEAESQTNPTVAEPEHKPRDSNTASRSQKPPRATSRKPPSYNPLAGQPNAVYDVDYRVITPPSTAQSPRRDADRRNTRNDDQDDWDWQEDSEW
jgi:hypothetical protein